MSELGIDYRDIIKSQLPRFIYINHSTEANVLGNVLNKIQEETDQLEREVNPFTASSIGLSKWERFFNIPVNSEIDLEIRRDKVLAELMQLLTSVSVITKEQMEKILSFYGANVRITENFAEYFFDVEMVVNESYNHRQIKELIQEIKPAYVGYGVMVSFCSGEPSMYLGAAVTEVERVTLAAEPIYTDKAVENETGFNSMRFNG